MRVSLGVCHVSHATSALCALTLAGAAVCCMPSPSRGATRLAFGSMASGERSGRRDGEAEGRRGEQRGVSAALNVTRPRLVSLDSVVRCAIRLGERRRLLLASASLFLPQVDSTRLDSLKR